MRRGKNIQCPYCNATDYHQSVKDSRIVKEKGTLRRRRLCGNCNARYTTYELTKKQIGEYENIMENIEGIFVSLKNASDSINGVREDWLRMLPRTMQLRIIEKEAEIDISFSNTVHAEKPE